MTDTSGGGALARLEAMLIDDWRGVLKRAWSVRLLAISFVLDGLEAAVNVITSWHVPVPVSPGVFAAFAALTTAAAGIARFVAQRKT